MHKFLPAVAFLALASSAAYAGDEDDESSIAPTALPAPILAAITAAYPGGTIQEASSEKEDGATTYEATVKVGERSLDLAFAADGKQLEEEEVIAVTAAPGPVQVTLATYAGWTVKRVERSTVSGVTMYEAALVQGDKRMEVKVDASGAVVKGKERAAHADER